MNKPLNMRTRAVLGVAVTALLVGLLPVVASAAPRGKPARPGHVDVLFVGAHPDDEHGILSTLGQWHENDGITAGVVTITRGEGGGNAVGPQEGPPLGLLREGEERTAVGRAGIEDVHYLDKVDFFYTVSAPLTRSVWGERDSLSRVVRLVRQTTPSVIITMNPAPVPGQHGNHQEAGRLATQAYYDAADPAKFPDQITREHLDPWRAGRLFQDSADGTGPNGPDCARDFHPADPSRDVYGVWGGTPSRRHGGNWAEVEARATRDYRSQGYSDAPDPPDDPAKIECDRFTQIDSRVPFTVGSTAPDAMLEGATKPARGGLPAGTGFSLSTNDKPTPGGSFTVTATVRAASHEPLRRARVALHPPRGWSVTGNGSVGTVPPGKQRRASFTVTVPKEATPGDHRLRGRLSAAAGYGGTSRPVTVLPTVSATPQRLPQFADFDDWAQTTGVPQLQGPWENRLSLGSGRSRTVPVTVRNNGTRQQSGTVRLNLPNGFSVSPATAQYRDLAAGKATTVRFTVTNTDKSLPTANQGPNDGDYRYTITATGNGGIQHGRQAMLNLVPVSTVGQVPSAPKVDGKAAEGEYPGQAMNVSRRWEGDPCGSAADCSANAHVSRHGDTLYFLVHVTDDVPGTKVSTADCKRHWRTDSVEIDIDPRGNSENTATTFKTGIFPATVEGGPCFERDADNHQGPGAETAPRMRVASAVSKPYTGYTVEAAIPMADLPAAVDPDRVGLNVLTYDSDTQDKTGQTRLGYSPFEGVQGDPYRWGQASLPGYQPPPGRPTQPADPVIAKTAARSVKSPASVVQAATTGIPLAGQPAAPVSDSARLLGRARADGDGVTAALQATGPGTAHLYVWDPDRGALGSREVDVPGAGLRRVRVPLTDAPNRKTVALLAFEAKEGGTASTRAPVNRA